MKIVVYDSDALFSPTNKVLCQKGNDIPPTQKYSYNCRVWKVEIDND